MQFKRFILQSWPIFLSVFARCIGEINKVFVGKTDRASSRLGFGVSIKAPYETRNRLSKREREGERERKRWGLIWKVFLHTWSSIKAHRMARRPLNSSLRNAHQATKCYQPSLPSCFYYTHAQLNRFPSWDGPVGPHVGCRVIVQSWTFGVGGCAVQFKKLLSGKPDYKDSPFLGQALNNVNFT